MEVVLNTINIVTMLRENITASPITTILRKLWPYDPTVCNFHRHLSSADPFVICVNQLSTGNGIFRKNFLTFCCLHENAYRGILKLYLISIKIRHQEKLQNQRDIVGQGLFSQTPCTSDNTPGPHRSWCDGTPLQNKTLFWETVS